MSAEAWDSAGSVDGAVATEAVAETAGEEGDAAAEVGDTNDSRSWWSRWYGDDHGMSTAEYAIGTIAAAAFGAILYTVVTGDGIVGALTDIIDRALRTSV